MITNQKGKGGSFRYCEPVLICQKRLDWAWKSAGFIALFPCGSR